MVKVLRTRARNPKRRYQRKLLTISPATIDRVLKNIKVRFGRGRSGTKPGTLLRTQIPIRTDYWDATIPGYLEADTFAQ